MRCGEIHHHVDEAPHNPFYVAFGLEHVPGGRGHLVHRTLHHGLVQPMFVCEVVMNQRWLDLRPHGDLPQAGTRKPMSSELGLCSIKDSLLGERRASLSLRRVTPGALLSFQRALVVVVAFRRWHPMFRTESRATLQSPSALWA